MEVRILSKKFIKSSPPTPALQNIRISFIDQFVPLAHVACIFYYPIPDQSAYKAITAQLEKSFSKTLTLFYPLVGLYAKEDLSVECNHEGGAFLEAQLSGELASIVNGGGDPKLFRRFLSLGVGEVVERTTPLVGVQVSVFKCGGLAVGVLLSHRIADAYTVATFIDAWAKVGRGGIGEVVGPSFERKNSKIVTRRFVFDAASIASLKARFWPGKSKMELADLAGLVGEAIKSRLARYAKAQNEEDLFHE
ncbi:acetyl-CoA-benzylalcohol acetyltransferase-like [Actinidia eriantha]|uniref:acetyl-CoA-benzylalcohol acetyltransferase-like n=1 Tax=Actinidia eriantha TaxID=165200 RepID=UPI002588DEF7|nr:acetyl-CoA-benzylalcohol acetyltransferase-like [Actinidia eriantha]